MCILCSALHMLWTHFLPVYGSFSFCVQVDFKCNVMQKNFESRPVDTSYKPQI